MPAARLTGHISESRTARSSQRGAAPASRKPPGSPPLLLRGGGEPWLMVGELPKEPNAFSFTSSPHAAGSRAAATGALAAAAASSSSSSSSSSLPAINRESPNRTATTHSRPSPPSPISLQQLRWWGATAGLGGHRCREEERKGAVKSGEGGFCSPDWEMELLGGGLPKSWCRPSGSCGWTTLA